MADGKEQLKNMLNILLTDTQKCRREALLDLPVNDHPTRKDKWYEYRRLVALEEKLTKALEDYVS